MDAAREAARGLVIGLAIGRRQPVAYWVTRWNTRLCGCALFGPNKIRDPVGFPGFPPIH